MTTLSLRGTPTFLLTADGAHRAEIAAVSCLTLFSAEHYIPHKYRALRSNLLFEGTFIFVR
jgi:hypothetical protein